MNRYMTQEAKFEELRGWEAAKRERAANPPPGFVGGVGYPDPEIYAFVDRLNRLHRVCTLQSCAGHRCTPESMCDYCAVERMNAAREDGSTRDVAEHIWSGQLWLWTDQTLAWWFLAHASDLAVEPCIEKVSVHFHVEGKQVIDLVFKGAGTGGLDASMAVICGFFERGNRECNLQ